MFVELQMNRQIFCGRPHLEPNWGPNSGLYGAWGKFPRVPRSYRGRAPKPVRPMGSLLVKGSPKAVPMSQPK
jgi:hypothetical protein